MLISNLTTLFLSKPPRGSLPVFSAHSFTIGRQLAPFDFVEKGKNSPTQNIPEAGIYVYAACILRRYTTNQATIRS